MRGAINALRLCPPWVRLLAAIATFAASLWLLETLFGTMAGTAIMVSVAAHELSHLVVLRYFGHRGGIIFLSFYAVTYAEVEYNPSKVSWAIFAGPGINCLIGLACLPLIASPFFQTLVSINFALALLNLAPIPLGTDGLKIIEIITKLCREKPKAAYRLLNAAEAIGAAGTIIMMNKLGVFFPVLAACSFVKDVITRMGEGWRPRPFIGGLTKRQATIQALLYLLIIVSSTVGLWLTTSVSL